ncbi:MAG TPA: response regulator, partial [Candidatus Acidoferrales bacterium]|nr:response regulator [Candidatus Acidoferrales bacterium]
SNSGRNGASCPYGGSVPEVSTLPTILVADDNSNIQKMVSLVFEEKGIRVVAVGNGEAACRKMPEVRPDLVLADVFMPVRNGYEVCEFVKQTSQFARIPVILLVGAFDPLDEKEARRVGADGVLKKPFVPPDPLIAMVTSLLPKIEPVVVPPAPPKEEIPEPPAWKPKPRPPIPEFEEPEGVPPEFAFGATPARDFEPVAIPEAKNAEEGDDDEEPASEWTRRRKTLEYEIPASESASMVEKLAGGKMAPDDSETLETSVHSKAHVPFAGANVPEKVESSSTGARTKWMDLMGIGESKAAEPDVEEAPKAAAPVQEEPTSSTVSSEPSNGAANKYAITKTEDTPNDVSREKLPQHSDLEPEHASAQQTDWPAPPAEVIPFPAPEESSSAATPHAPEEATLVEPLLEETSDAAPSYTVENISAALSESDSAPSQGHYEAPAVEISATESSVEAEIPEKFDASVMETAHAASTEKAISEAVSAVTAKNAELDAAAIDSVVAKLLEKLQPQIHEALSSSVLRPLVEEMLNRERDKK